MLSINKLLTILPSVCLQLINQYYIKKKNENSIQNVNITFSNIELLLYSCKYILEFIFLKFEIYEYDYIAILFIAFDNRNVWNETLLGY